MVTSPTNRSPKQVQMHHKQQSQKAAARPATSAATPKTPKNHGSAKNAGAKSGVKRVHSSPAVQQQQQQNVFRTPNTGKKSAPPSDQQQQQQQRRTPHHQQRASQTPSPRAFAGSKCYEPPTPMSLPKPPPSWTGKRAPAPLVPVPSHPSASADQASQHLKLLLKVQC